MKVEFSSGISHISGSMKSSRFGHRVIFTHRKNDKSGFGHAYIRPADAYKRSTPLSDNERRARADFQTIALKTNGILADEKERMAFHEEWKKAKGKFNGKKYATLRGYIMAVLFDELKRERQKSPETCTCDFTADN